MSTRCSTARGPARSPSLVTWPTRSSGAPVDLAMRVRRSTQVRTWARLPAGWPSSGSETDWSESTTTSAGRCRSTAASIASTSGPSMARRFRGTRPMREARPRTWASDSSAEASMTSSPVAASDESTWKSSVDLPMPGGPNSSVTEPATTPPPMTRSSSLTPVASGCMASVETSASASAGGPSAGADGRRHGAPAPDRACSTRRRRGSVPPSATRSPRRTRREMRLRRGRACGEPWPWRHPTGGVSQDRGSSTTDGTCDRDGRLGPWTRDRRRGRVTIRPASARRRRGHPRRRGGRVLLRRDARPRGGAGHRPGHLVGATRPPLPH